MRAVLHFLPLAPALEPWLSLLSLDPRKAENDQPTHSNTKGASDMKKLGFLLRAPLIGVTLYAVAYGADAQTKDEQEIRALEQRFAAAFKAKDVNAIMSGYVADESLFVFDVVPPRQYIGAKAYRKDWEDFFAAFPGPVDTFEISDLSVMTDGKLGFSHSIQRAVLTDKDGKKADIAFRLTDVYRKMNGKWLIIHEHVSVPVDLATGKADLSTKP